MERANRKYCIAFGVLDFREKGKLSQSAFCFDYDKKICALSNLCPEKWSFGLNSDNVILQNDVDHTLEKAFIEHKVIEKPSYSLFNTGLYTNFYEEIYAYFIENQNEDKQKWFLD